MMIRALGTILSIFAMIAAALFVVPQTASADPADMYCVGLAEKVAPDRPDLIIQSVTCSDTPPVTSQAVITIVQFYEHGGFQGRRFDLTVTAGPCDGAGYSINNMDGINGQIGGMSSYRLFNQCNRSGLYTGLNKTGSYSSTLFGDQPQVPGAFNDRTRSFRTWHG